MASIEFLGVGAATDFSRGQTSVLYRGSAVLLVDCGPQVPAVLVPKLTGPDELDAIYVTHSHADHCFGLGSLLLWLRLAGRKRPLVLYAEVETLQRLSELLKLGYPGAFTPEKCFPLEWQPLTSNRSVRCLGCVLSVAQTDHNVTNCALRIDDGAVRIAFSGDGIVTAQTLKLYAGCDWVVQECAYAEQEHTHHMNLPRVVAMVDALRPKTVYLTHCLEGQRPIIEAAVKRLCGVRVAQPRDVISLSD
jgi:ribonuclease BN (tRNA processing enzyme)